MRKKTDPNEQPVTHKRKRRRLWLKILLVLVVILIIFRLILPYIVLKYVNKELKNLSEYTGSVKDVDLHLYRGAYLIKDIVIKKIDKKGNETDTIPFFTSTAVDLSLEWSSLFKGAIAGKLYVYNPVLNFVSGKHKDEDVKQDTSDFRQLIRNLMPLTVNRFEIKNGQIHFIDLGSDPKIDIAMTKIYVVASNLTNVINKKELLPATVSASADVYEGTFSTNIRLDPLKKNPTFELKTDVRNINLVSLNEFLKAYGNFQVEKGLFSIYAEFAGKEGNFGGYVKPFLADVKVKKWKEKEDLKQRIWEFVVGASLKILSNPKTDDVATKVNINGKFSDPGINVWRAISFVLRNAFVQALRPSIENSININKLNDESKKTFLEKVFGSGDKKKDEKKSDKKKKKEKK
jgi:hypothetical protein